MKLFSCSTSSPKQAFRGRKLIVLAALFFSVVNAGFCGDRLGRLFFLPTERDKLDAKIQALVAQKAPKKADLPENAVPNVSLSIDGLVLPKYGAPSIWINGINQDELNDADKPIMLRVHPKRRGELILPNRKELRIKVGDAIEPLSGEKIELLGDDARHIKRHRKNDASSDVPR